jgi:aldose sugar dehydrogenase
MRLAFAAASVIALAACNSGGTAAAPAGAPFESKTVATLDEPWAMAFLPGRGVAMTDTALVTLKAGKVLLVNTKTGASQEVLGVPKVAYGGQGGLGDVIVHPDFAGNGYVYLSWAEEGEGGYGAVVGRAKLVMSEDTPRLEGLQIIWKQSPKVSGRGHYGHRMAFGPDKMLYISSGERQKFDPAQDIRGNLGKVLRLNDDGTPATDNPMSAVGGAMSSSTDATLQIWSSGHRNPLGLAFDPEGRLWNTEMGPQGGDELNLVVKGANYGYPIKSNGSHYGGKDIPDHTAGDGFLPPKLWWNPSISPGSLMIYSGDLFPNWKGDAFIGALGGEALVRVDLVGDAAIKADQWPMGARIREVEQGPDGAIWLLEDGDGARLMKLTPR